MGDIDLPLVAPIKVEVNKSSKLKYMEEHKIVSFKELYNKKLPEIKVSFEEGNYSIYSDGKELYWIDEPRLKKESHLIEWMCHLSGKKWWTSNMARKLRDEFYKRNPKKSQNN